MTRGKCFSAVARELVLESRRAEIGGALAQRPGVKPKVATRLHFPRSMIAREVIARACGQTRARPGIGHEARCIGNSRISCSLRRPAVRARRLPQASDAIGKFRFAPLQADICADAMQICMTRRRHCSADDASRGSGHKSCGRKEKNAVRHFLHLSCCCDVQDMARASG